MFCDDNHGCSGLLGRDWVADYCQPLERTATGKVPVQLNTTTAKQTSYRTKLLDTAYYFYDLMDVIGASHDTGDKYEINLTVSGKQHLFVFNINEY